MLEDAKQGKSPEAIQDVKDATGVSHAYVHPLTH